MVSHKLARWKNSRPQEERGQVIVLVVVMLIVLLGFAALVIDVGYAYYAHRSLQASADAAALAGAQELPNIGAAVTVARQYSASAGNKNEQADINGVKTTVTTKCIESIPGCDLSNPAEVNTVVVSEKAPAKTFFAGVLGIKTFDIAVRATACSPCGVQPLDIMIVLDRTGSMCDTPGCTDLVNAREGIKTFLRFLEPTTQWVGLAVLPPARSTGQTDRCATPDESRYNSRSAAYTIVRVDEGNNYSKGRVLEDESKLVKTLNCQKANGRTAYANALESAQAELERNDLANNRSKVKNVIVFLSDGAANTGPAYTPEYPSTSPYRTKPCQQGVDSAVAIRNKGTRVYSIGYDLDHASQVCVNSVNGKAESPAITAHQAVERIAFPAVGASPSGFYNKPSPGQLKTIFTEIAADLAKGTSALIDDETQ